MSLRDKVNGSANPESPSTDTLITADFTADYEAGIAYANARAKAFADGVKDQTNLIQQGLKSFSVGTFVLAKPTYLRPALPPSDEQAGKSLMTILYGEAEVVNEQ
jgi:hypothetical protein